ncbi:MAG TPA: 30S ribosomal protein S2, partial [Anaerolineales bacterium]|nr:30S ribosomal protein S2 [Anaerolineales bacterium]
MSLISMKSLLETGVHFGHRTQKWHPKMKPYIFTERNGIHIIDLQQTVGALEAAYNLIRDTVSKRGVVLFVGTKRQAQDTIQKEAERSGLPYVNQRWLGGTLTNWRTIKEQISELKRLEEGKLTGKFTLLTKKEQLMIDRRIVKLNDRLGGIRSMTKLPDLLFIV